MSFLQTFSGNPFSPEDIINKLIPNGIWPVVTQLLTTIVLVIIVQKLLYKPVRAMLDKRAEHIKRNIDEAERDQQLAASKLGEAERKLGKAKQEAQAIILSAHEDMDSSRAATLEETRETARRLKLKADEDILAAKEQALDDIRKEMVDLAIKASERVLERELVHADDDKIVDDFIKGRIN